MKAKDLENGVKFHFVEPLAEQHLLTGVYMRVAGIRGERHGIVVNYKDGSVIQLAPLKTNEGYSWADEVIQLDL